MKTAVQFLKETFVLDKYLVRPTAVCCDGFTISIQGGTSYHYCQPRELCDKYKEVELGFPSEPDDLIRDYAEDPDDLTGTVYGYVPINIVEILIKKHGGII